jgi:hypothetical protein
MCIVAAGLVGGCSTAPPAEQPGPPVLGAAADPIREATWLVVIQASDADVPQEATALAILPNMLATSGRVTEQIKALRRDDADVIVALFRHHSGERLEPEVVWTHPDFDPKRPDSPDVGLIRVAGTLPSFIELDADAAGALAAGQTIFTCGFTAVATGDMDFHELDPPPLHPRVTCLTGSVQPEDSQQRLAAQAGGRAAAIHHDFAPLAGLSGSSIFDEDFDIVGLLAGDTSGPRSWASPVEVIAELPVLILSNLVVGFDFATGMDLLPDEGDPDEATCRIMNRCCPSDAVCDRQPCVGEDPDCSGCGLGGTCVLDCEPLDPDCTNQFICDRLQRCCAEDGRCDSMNCPVADEDCLECEEGGDCVLGCTPLDPDCTPASGCERDGDCSDGLFCNGVELCNPLTKLCIAGVPPCSSTGGQCDEIRDACSTPQEGCTANGDCDDGMYCNGAERCNPFTHACAPGMRPCDDTGASATQTCVESTDSCISSSACQTNDDCDDGLFCDGVETCHVLSGLCLIGARPCHDLGTNATETCTEGVVGAVCNPLPGCTTNGDCDDGLFCNGPETCASGDCAGGAAPCNPTTQTCNESQDACAPLPAGCTTNADCNDGLFCNGNETCSSGTCSAGAPPDCNDGVACTADACNESADACDHLPDHGDCDDGMFCNGAETCSASGCQPGSSVNCNDGVACTADMCSEDNDACVNLDDDTACDDGLFCNGSENCTPAGCQPGNDPCPGNFCDEAGNHCVDCLTNTDCGDGLFCNGAETCNTATGACQAGANPCPGEMCNETSNACVECLIDANCSDGLFCNGVEDCAAGACVPGSPPCAGQMCNESSDTCAECLVDADCDDGLFCNGAEDCAAGACAAGTPPCPGQMCIENSDSCANCLADADCDDGLFCNGAEDCAAGACAAGTPPCPGQMCNEGSDSCAGCLVNADCSDGLFCNGVETCINGTCQPGVASNCDDGVACTTDACDEGTDACTHAPNHAACDNGQFCDGPETCTAAGCTAGERPCDDGGDPPAEMCDEAQDMCMAIEPCGTFENATGLAIPDDSPPGVTQTLSVTEHILIEDLDLDLVINHTRDGDLVVTLSNGVVTITLISRPGGQGNEIGSLRDGFDIILDDGGAGGPIEGIPVTEGPAILSPPSYVPDAALSSFAGSDAFGTWTLKVSDRNNGETGNLVSWALIINGDDCP